MCDPSHYHSSFMAHNGIWKNRNINVEKYIYFPQILDIAKKMLEYIDICIPYLVLQNKILTLQL